MTAFPSWLFHTSSAFLCSILVVSSAHAGRCKSDVACQASVQDGATAFARQDYAHALSAFSTAHGRSRQPELLINIGCAYFGLKLYKDAQISFQAFLQQRADSRLAPTVRRYLEVVAQRVAGPPPSPPAPALALPVELATETSAAPAMEGERLVDAAELTVVQQLPPPVANAGAKSPIRSLLISSAIAASLGLAGAAVGIGCYGGQLAVRERFRNSSDEFVKHDLLNEGERMGQASIAGYLVAAFASVGGFALAGTALVIRYHRHRVSRLQFRPQITPASLGLDIQGVLP